jgi:sugar/nucleoside kinase (ribokinase family)
VPEELPALIDVLPSIAVLRYDFEKTRGECWSQSRGPFYFVSVRTSPNAEEALSLLSLPELPTKQSVEHAATKFLDMGVGKAGAGCVIIRSGAMGAYVTTREKGGQWVDAYWIDNKEKVIDVTGRSLAANRT